MTKHFTALDHARFQYELMVNALEQIGAIAANNDWKDLEQTCIMFETDMKEIEFALDQVGGVVKH